MKTSLAQYDLWFDGSLECNSMDIEQFISKVPVGMLAVDKITANILQYNKLVSKSEAIGTKTICNALDFNWNIPIEYQTLDMKTFLLDKLLDIDEIHPTSYTKARLSRMLQELAIYTAQGLLPVLQCLAYVIDTFIKNGVVWGVGRGSSVSSYILYLIGVHDIDCVLYNLPFSDFMKT